MVSIWRRESHLGSKIMAQSCPVRKNVKNIRRCQIASSKTSGTFKTPEFWCKDTGNSCARHLISAIRGSVHCTCTCSEEIFVAIGISCFVAITFNAMKHVHCALWHNCEIKIARTHVFPSLTSQTQRASLVSSPNSITLVQYRENVPPQSKRMNFRKTFHKLLTS